ncbi:MAG: putative ABC transporter permease [Bacilli bacterium]|nr:putative ABC transporter permease [Bacilli bacterium]MDD4298232.1 putative ABC transporter permease [Bacilli bacterium]MDD4643660.1 putative ABC transporter permease [Bacilli bacterium]
MLNSFLYFFLLFIIYSFIGWIIEMIATFVGTKKLINRGFLIGPYCPIYGFGALIMLYILSSSKNNIVYLYVMFVVYASLLEYITSYLMEKLFNARWWDYSKDKYNLNGRICLSNSLAFGILGIVLGYIINPFVVKTLNMLSPNTMNWIAILLFIIFALDFLITFNIVSRIRKNIILINKDMTEDINKQISKFIATNHIFKAFPLLKQKIDKIKR